MTFPPSGGLQVAKQPNFATSVSGSFNLLFVLLKYVLLPYYRYNAGPKPNNLGPFMDFNSKLNYLSPADYSREKLYST